LKYKHIPILSSPTTIRKREEWLCDLKRCFKGARRRYRRDERKIIHAVDYMDQEGKGRWDRHVDEKTPIEREVALNSWDQFEQWTLDLVKDAANRNLMLSRSWESAHQGQNQSPQEFHYYLDSLEKHLPKMDEGLRALIFFAKLQNDLQDHFTQYSATVPNNRAEMVTLATRFWDSLHRQPSGGKRRAPAPPESSNKSTKRSEGDHAGKNAHIEPKQERAPGERKQNPKDAEGKVLRCFGCGSTEHLRHQCASPKKAQRTYMKEQKKLRKST
jgi:hypothetical protein